MPNANDKQEITLIDKNNPEGTFFRALVDTNFASSSAVFNMIVRGMGVYINTDRTNDDELIRLGNSDGSFKLYRYDGAPELSLTANVGDLCTDVDSGILYIKGGSDNTNTDWVDASSPYVPSPVNYVRNYNFNSRPGASGTAYMAGFYFAPATAVTLTNLSTTQTLAGANTPHGAHAFIVASGAGTTDGTDLILTVSGTSVDDFGIRTTLATEDIVLDAESAAQDEYYETTNRWVGQVTYTLSSTAGTTFSFAFNYGLAKYDNNNSTRLQLSGFEFIGFANATDAAFDIEVIKHGTTGWTYDASSFVPGPTATYKLTTDYGVESDLDAGEQFCYQRSGLSDTIDGASSEGIIVRVTTGANDAVNYMNARFDLNETII